MAKKSAAKKKQTKKSSSKKKQEKIFYKIGEVCGMTDTEPYVLRYWESEFPDLAPQKNRSGQRIYAQEDVDMVLRIKELLYDEGYTIAGARRRLKEEAESDGAVKPQAALAEEAHEELEELRGTVKRIRSELEEILEMLA